MNRVCLTGRLGKDPESKKVGDKTCTTFSIATGRGEYTEWHDIKCWGSPADFAAEYLKKGALVSVDGMLKTEKWKDDNGPRSRTWVVCNGPFSLESLQKLEKEDDEKPARSSTKGKKPPPRKPDVGEEDEDDGELML